jgi:DNA-directed RNA polymerase subunit RPC12/RpoP
LDLESILAAAILIIVLLMFIFMFAIVALSFIKWFRTPTYPPSPTIKIEDYSCPKCGSKELEVVGRRTLRCKKCGTTFTIQPETAEERWIVWPFFWWFPIILPIPVKKHIKRYNVIL